MRIGPRNEEPERFRTMAAQQGGRIPRIGFLWHAGSREEESPNIEAVIEGFAKLGYVEGRNIIALGGMPSQRILHRYSITSL